MMKIKIVFVYFFVLCCTIMPGHGPRISSSPYISGDGFRAISHAIYDDAKSFNPAHIKKPSIIFIKTDLLFNFFRHIYPHIKAPIILITHNSDKSAPGKYLSRLNDKKIIHWFASNPSVAHHHKLSPIPIGIGNAYTNHGDINNFNLIRNELDQITEKEHLLHINFTIVTNREDRSYAMQQLIYNQSPRFYFGENVIHANYLRQISSSTFTASPKGGGLDCHRTWEALLFNTIPIVVTSELDSIYKDLPVLIINDWNEVTDEFLCKKEHEIKQQTFNHEKIFMPYWEKKIQDCLKQYKNKKKNLDPAF